MKTYLTADTHYGDGGIFQIEERWRLADDVDDMDNLMIERHNRQVQPHDKVIFIGDFTMKGMESLEFFILQPPSRRHLKEKSRLPLL